MYLEPIEHPDITETMRTGYPHGTAYEPCDCDDCDYDICEECRVNDDCYAYNDDGELECVCNDCPYGEDGA